MFYLIEIISKLLALPSEALAKEGCWCAAQGSGLRAQSTGQLPTSCLYAFTPSCLHAFMPFLLPTVFLSFGLFLIRLDDFLQQGYSCLDSLILAELVAFVFNINIASVA